MDGHSLIMSETQSWQISVFFCKVRQSVNDTSQLQERKIESFIALDGCSVFVCNCKYHAFKPLEAEYQTHHAALSDPANKKKRKSV